MGTHQELASILCSHEALSSLGFTASAWKPYPKHTCDCVTGTEGALTLVCCGVFLFPPSSVGLILGITTRHLVSCDAILSTQEPPLPLDVPTFPFCFHTSGQVPPLPSQSWIYHTLPSEAHQRHSLCKSLLYFMTFPFYSSTTSIPQLIASAQTPSLVGVLHP